MSEELSVLSFSQNVAEQEAPLPIPIGNYPAVVEKCTASLSRSSGNPMLVTQMRVSPDDFPADYDVENAPDGVLLTYYRSGVDDARSRYAMRKYGEALGVVIGTEVDPNEFIGLDCMIEVEQEEYEGEVRARIRNVMPAV